ncbi:MAG: metallophosphoesterase [Planctomycetia bacterium]|nr:metallophosphoesterase [Planctomycetia bacterium]
MIRFGLFTDMQYADREPARNRDYRKSLDKFIAVAGSFHQEKLSRVFHLGDIVNDGWSNLTQALELFDKSELPLIHVLGNHDFIIDDDKKNRLPSLLRLPDCGYYAMELPDPDDPDNRWKCMILNGNENAPYVATNDSDREKAERLREKYRLVSGNLPEPWNGTFSPKQLQWLRDELNTAQKENWRVLLCSHFPLYAQANTIQRAAAFGPLANVGIYFSLMGVSAWNGQEMLSLIEAFPCVKAWFAGHLHEGSYGLRKNIHHVTFRGMVEAEPNAWSIITLAKNSIKIDGFGTEPDRELIFNH